MTHAPEGQPPPTGGHTRRDALRRFAVAGGALALPGALGGELAARASAAQGASAATTEIPSFTWAIQGSVPSLDIATGFASTAQEIMSLGLEGLVGLNDDLTIKPVLAESWSQPDPLRYVYNLRSGVKFWDGTPLMAADVQYSLNRQIDPKVGSQIGTFYESVKSIDITGPMQVTVRMKTPDPAFHYVPVLTYITPKAFSEKLGKKLGQSGATVNTMGTGPYRITSFNSATGATVERNEGYWGPKPDILKASLQIITDPETALLAVQSGSVDGTDTYPFDLAHNYDTLSNVKTYYSVPLGEVAIAFNVTVEPWNDIHARKAAAHCADRAGYIHAFLAGHGTVAEAVVPPGDWASTASAAEVSAIYAKIPQYAYSLSAAKAELAKSAHPHGFSAEIEYPSTVPYIGKALLAWSQTLQSIGINLKVTEVTSAKWLADLYANDSPMFMLQFFPDYPDPSDYMLLFPSANAVKNNFNSAHFKDPAVDKLLAQQATASKAARPGYLAQILDISGQELPYLPFWWQPTPLALSTKYAYPGFNVGYYLQPWLTGISAKA